MQGIFQEAFDERVPEIFVEGGLGGEAVEDANNLRIVVALQQWNQRVAKAGTEPVLIKIRSIFAPTLAECFEVTAQVLTAQVDQRTDEIAVYWANSRQAARARAAKEAGQNSFRLVVSSMSGSNFIAVVFGDERGEKIIAGSAAGILQVQVVSAGVSSAIHAGCEELQVELTGKHGDKFLVGVRIVAAKLVIQVNYAK